MTNISNGRYSILTTSQYTYYDAAGNKKTANGTAMYLGAGKGVTTLTGNANLPTGFTFRDKFYVVTRIAPYTLSGTSGTPYTLGGGPNLTTIDEYAFYNCPTISSLTITGPLTKVGMDAFSVMTNCAEVTLETDNDISPSFTNRLYGGCKSGFKFFVNNKIYYSCFSNMGSWGSINSDSQMRSQLKPFLKAEANVQPFSCYMDYVDLSASGLTNAYWVTGYDSSKATLKTTKATSGQSNIWSRGLILTNLTPGKIYKLQYGTSNYLMVTTYLTHNGKTPTTVNASSGYHVWNAGSKTFVKPTSSVTVPVGSAMLSLPTSAQSINTWTIDILGNPYDVNNDGKVDVGDVNTVLAAILAHSNNAKYDVNGDTKVDVGDVNTILAAILN